ncbi:MAG: hypothetical protein GF334_04265 [Candidatus Altiarchaeales archaeon]|nr:hypothetical protein [Candidatus Altiarchaeales archaeon]
MSAKKRKPIKPVERGEFDSLRRGRGQIPSEIHPTIRQLTSAELLVLREGFGLNQLQPVFQQYKRGEQPEGDLPAGANLPKASKWIQRAKKITVETLRLYHHSGYEVEGVGQKFNELDEKTPQDLGGWDLLDHQAKAVEGVWRDLDETITRQRIKPVKAKPTPQESLHQLIVKLTQDDTQREAIPNISNYGVWEVEKMLGVATLPALIARYRKFDTKTGTGMPRAHMWVSRAKNLTLHTIHKYMAATPDRDEEKIQQLKGLGEQVEDEIGPQEIKGFSPRLTGSEITPDTEPWPAIIETTDHIKGYWRKLREIQKK